METIIVELLRWVPLLIASYISYNQYSKNKRTDLKIDELKLDMQLKSNQKMEDIACIYSELYRLLHSLQTDRVYILQPHPLINNQYVTISLEVRKRGISPMLGQIKRLPMSEVPGFVGQLAKNCTIYSNDLEKDFPDKRAKSILGINGTKQILIQKLIDFNNRWVGNLFIENMEIDPELFSEETIKLVQEAANNIQFVLPEYKDII